MKYTDEQLEIIGKIIEQKAKVLLSIARELVEQEKDIQIDDPEVDC